MQRLGPSPHIYPISASLVQMASSSPDYLQWGMICMILSHRINRTRGEQRCQELNAKFYNYWGLAVQSLNRHLDTKCTHDSNMLIAGILTLLLADVSQRAFLSGLSLCI